MEEHLLARALAVLTDGMPPIVAANTRLVKHVHRTRDSARVWLHSKNVQACGVGSKLVKGDDSGELAIRVYVAQKYKPRAGQPRIPKTVTVTVPEVGQVPTDVIEIGPLRQQSFHGRLRPARPGIGVGHGDTSAGTIACVVRRRGNDNRLYILSNAHILANSGLANIGDPVYQPAPADAEPSEANILGRLAAFQRLEFSASTFPNRVDAAIASVNATRIRPEIRRLGFQPTRIVTQLERGMRVQKVGRSTDLTYARIEDVNINVATTYPRRNGSRSRAGFSGQIACTRFASDGDSGAAVLSEDGALVGLHFMGSDSLSIFHPIAFVFEALELELP